MLPSGVKITTLSQPKKEPRSAEQVTRPRPDGIMFANPADDLHRKKQGPKRRGCNGPRSLGNNMIAIGNLMGLVGALRPSSARHFRLQDR
jgi:hypothetical protein